MPRTNPTYATLRQRVKELEQKDAELLRSERELRRRLELEKMVVDISTHAISPVSPAAFQQECLDMMGAVLDVSRIYIFEHHHESDTMDNTHEWVADGIAPQKGLLQGISAQIVPWWTEMMQKNIIINYANIEDIPGSEEKEILRQQNIKSILVVPLFIRETYQGFMGFDECRRQREWREADVDILRTVAQIVSATTERMESAEALAAERKQLLSIFESINHIIYVSDPNTYEVLYVNTTLKELLNTNPVGGLCYKEFQNLDHPCDFCTNEIILKQKYKPYQWEHHNHIVDRSYLIVDRLIKWPDDRDVRFEFAFDISDRKTAEMALHESEEKYRQLFEMESDAIFLIDNSTGEILEVNAAAASLYGFSRDRLLKMKNTDLSAEPEETRKATLRAVSIVPVRYHKKKDGTIFPVEITARHFTWQGRQVHVAAIRDITLRIETEKEKNSLQAQLLQAQKMEAIGTLAGGLAHDFNNLLMGIQGNTSLMLADIDPVHPHCESLKNIEKLVVSGAKLTSQLLGFARKGKYEVTPIDLNHIVKQMAGTIGRTRKDIVFELELSENLLAIEADQGQMEQVLLNLIINAVDAMANSGKIFLKTANLSQEDLRGKVFSPKPGRYVRLTITDTGAGMDKETLAKIFDPFFTTKEMGRGTGLGLASVYGIVKAHGGYIEAFSEKGMGSSFTIYLPGTEKKLGTREDASGTVFVGKGTILIVDDEEMVLDVGVRLLEKLGYNVIAAGSGHEAVELYSINRNIIDMVILDMVMPQMNGGETFDRIKAMDPKVKVLLSSGYSIDGQAKGIMKRGCAGFIQKPFNLPQLSNKIRSILSKA